ncbi:MAG TPA: homoserine O-succinyltransferase [Gemmatimonadaceae bacterium]|nr:homoserine O-succinyltransferase [Gemmatimonadaceae bacterium]
MESAAAVHTDPRPRDRVRQGLALALGLPPVRYEVRGVEGAPVIVALGGISASRHVARNDLDEDPGWWEGIVGARQAIDTERFQVIGIDWVTTLRGTSDRPVTAGIVTTFDQARAVCAVLDTLGVQSARAVVGASYGGMVALAFAARHPSRVERIVVIGAAHESDPLTTTLRAIQRRIVALAATAGVPGDGVALARALAMTTYRTRAEFASRFAMTPLFTDGGVTFPAEEYVIARGRDYATRTTAHDFLALTLSLDLHAVAPEDIRVPATVIGVKEDQLVPIEKIRELSARLGANAELIELSSVHGHDSFLNDSDQMAPFIADAVSRQ